jgi:hypothetical protein
MTYEQIIALTEKGFSPEQIMQLSGVRDSPSGGTPEPAIPPEPENPPEPVNPPEPENPPENNPQQIPGISELTASVRAMGEQLASLIASNQANNIKTISQNVNPNNIEQGADAILAGIIHPPMNEEKGGNAK